MEPLPRGSDFEFVDEIFGGAIPPAVPPCGREGHPGDPGQGYLRIPGRRLPRHAARRKFHAVDSNELSFKMAAASPQGRDDRCRPTILEPIMNVEVYVPTTLRHIMATSTDGAAGGGMEQRASMTVVKAQVPMSEMLTYEQTLTATTGARGTYKMEFSHYEEVPTHLQTKIVAAAKRPRARARRKTRVGPGPAGVGA